MPDRDSLGIGRGRLDTNRVVRGGSWNNNARNVRAAYRNHNEPSNRNNNLGFRLALAQTRPGWAAPDPACVPRVVTIRFDNGKHRSSCRCVSRAMDVAAEARRRFTLAQRFR